MNEYRYHSAMKKFGGVDKSSDCVDERVFKTDRITAFQHDICSEEIPLDFKKANAVFTVMSWRSGYKKYTENTIAKNTSFNEYCEAIGNVISSLKIPGFVITNKTFSKRLKAPRYENIHYDQFNSEDIVAIWNYTGCIPHSSRMLMKFVCNKYETVLDFCCGHGEVAEYAKKAILTDVNTGCIDYVRDRYIDGKTTEGNRRKTI